MSTTSDLLRVIADLTRGASPHRIAQLAEALEVPIDAITCCEGQP